MSEREKSSIPIVFFFSHSFVSAFSGAMSFWSSERDPKVCFLFFAIYFGLLSVWWAVMCGAEKMKDHHA